MPKKPWGIFQYWIRTRKSRKKTGVLNQIHEDAWWHEHHVYVSQGFEYLVGGTLINRVGFSSSSMCKNCYFVFQTLSDSRKKRVSGSWNPPLSVIPDVLIGDPAFLPPFLQNQQDGFPITHVGNDGTRVSGLRSCLQTLNFPNQCLTGEV